MSAAFPPHLSPKVLAKELKDLEAHQLVERIVHDEYPVLIEYSATAYSYSLKKVMLEFHAWGVNHHKQLFGN